MHRLLKLRGRFSRWPLAAFLCLFVWLSPVGAAEPAVDDAAVGDDMPDRLPDDNPPAAAFGRLPLRLEHRLVRAAQAVAALDLEMRHARLVQLIDQPLCIGAKRLITGAASGSNGGFDTTR